MTDQSTPNRYVPSSLQLERESILRRDTRTSLRKPSLAVAYSKPCDPPSGIHAANCECLSFDCKGSLTLFLITSPALSFTTMNSRSFAAELPGSAGLQNARKKAVCPSTLDPLCFGVKLSNKVHTLFENEYLKVCCRKKSFSVHCIKNPY